MGVLQFICAILFFILSADVPTEAAEASADLRAAQEALIEWGYDVGKADGLAGKKTEKAIREYQADWQLPDTGQLSPDLSQRLLRKHPATAPRIQRAIGRNDCDISNPFPQARETIEYVGSCIEGKPHGQGKITWRSMKSGKWEISIEEGVWRAGILQDEYITYLQLAMQELGFFHGEIDGLCQSNTVEAVKALIASNVLTKINQEQKRAYVDDDCGARVFLVGAITTERPDVSNKLGYKTITIEHLRGSEKACPWRRFNLLEWPDRFLNDIIRFLPSFIRENTDWFSKSSSGSDKESLIRTLNCYADYFDKLPK